MKVTPSLKIKILSSVIILMFALSWIPSLLTGYMPTDIALTGLQHPGLKHLCGTDFLGRDILSRTIAGAQASLLTGLTARLLSLILGVLFGLLIALNRGIIKDFFNGVTEIFLAIPSLLLALGLAVVLGEGYYTIVVAITIGTWAPAARYIAVRTVEIESRDYILSAKAIGMKDWQILLRYILPDLAPTLIPLLTTGLATAIMLEATLSFLGLGGSSSLTGSPSWGLMINEGAQFLFDAPWLIIPPSLALMVVILIFNRIGDIWVAGDKKYETF